ncbi:type IV pilus modification PilV family protein [Cetobacterium sp.]|uniref:type IV pilus modification PilV family protein n=1 Tax=Cetobacterium sp. TaxID=2071632 RepID=UPI003F3373A3
MKRKRKGFTLIEVMAGLAVFAILATIVSSMILTVNKYNGENKNQFDSSSISRAFNERIKSIRPSKNRYPVDWKEDSGNSEYYYISFNSIEELNKVIEEKLLKNNNKTEVIDGYYFKIDVNEEKIEDLSKESEIIGHKYGIKIKVQNKEREKVYVFDTKTIEIDSGISSVVDRRFAISSIG